MEHKERVDAGQGRKGSPREEFGKRILFASEASESLRNLESEGLDSTDGARREGSPKDQRPTRSKYTLRLESGPGKSNESTCDDSMTQRRTETSDLIAEPVSTTEQSMVKGCIEPVDENASESEA
jgi:hypothetical protein